MKTRGQFGFWAFRQQFKDSLRPCLLSFVIVMSAVLPAKATLEGDPELLKLVAMAHKDNRERIHTWQGHAQIEDTRGDANGLMLQQKNSAQFFLDREQEATRWKWTPEGRYTRKGGQLVSDEPDWTKDIRNEMKKNDVFYVCTHGYMTNEGERGNALVIWPPEKAREGAYSRSFDPMWYFRLKGYDLEKRLMFHYKNANNPKMSRRIIKRKGDLVIWETRGDVINNYEFDMSKGGNLVKYYGEDEKCTEQREWTYEEKDGVWVPKTYTLNIDKKPPHTGASGFTNRNRKVTFVENITNHPIDPSEFSLAKLGVTVGMKVSDHNIGVSYIYGGADKFPQEDEDMFLKETPAVQSHASVQDTEEKDDNPPTHEQHVSYEADSEHPIVAHVEQTRWPNHKKFFIVALVVLPILGLASFMILRKGRKEGVE